MGVKKIKIFKTNNIVSPFFEIATPIDKKNIPQYNVVSQCNVQFKIIGKVNGRLRCDSLTQSFYR